ncbi:hypothetical protein F3Y22_tig00002799pilonHSYRG00034 [Hibiscus syriacus]|uniref:alpha-1,2-Mannosidase n=1 Tax=Hibiscus syriacus TaxID=106335 RepID=A0A6A3CSR5_HIBSY|nr:hypothetical protein F3Y22_tig00002799pilonHSYRG00034 [Hibiscus syriacus]
MFGLLARQSHFMPLPQVRVLFHVIIIVHLCLLSQLESLTDGFHPTGAVANGVTPEEARQLRDEEREMFYHAFDGYMEHAFPLDEFRPLSCKGEDTLGSYALTLIDSLDTLALLGDRERFTASVEWIGNLSMNDRIEG